MDRRERLSALSYSGLGASTDLAHQPDGREIVTASLGWFRWSLPELRQGTFSGAPSIASDTGPVQAVAFTPRRRAAVRGERRADHLLVTVHFGRGEAERRICAEAGRDLTDAEQAAYLRGEELELCGTTRPAS